MGWLWKLFWLFLAVILFGLGVWPLSLLIFAFLLLPPVVKALRGRSAAESGGRGSLPVRSVAGALLLFLALLGLVAHGTYSPLFFGSLGVLVLAWGRVGQLPGSRFKPVEGSVLLRSSPFPVSWAAVAEVKLVTRDVARAMAGVTGTVIVSASGDPAIHVVVERRSLSGRAAEQEVVSELGEMARSLARLGAYLLPLDSAQAASVLKPRDEVRLGKNWPNFLASGAYDSLWMHQERGFAKFLGAFTGAGDSRAAARVPPVRGDHGRPPLLMEVYRAVGERISWPAPDRYAAFLSSLVATAGEPIGTRILDQGGGSQSSLVVRSQGSPEVELSRAQLRAVARMYETVDA